MSTKTSTGHLLNACTAAGLAVINSQDATDAAFITYTQAVRDAVAAGVETKAISQSLRKTVVMAATSGNRYALPVSEAAVPMLAIAGDVFTVFDLEALTKDDYTPVSTVWLTVSKAVKANGRDAVHGAVLDALSDEDADLEDVLAVLAPLTVKAADKPKSARGRKPKAVTVTFQAMKDQAGGDVAGEESVMMRDVSEALAVLGKHWNALPEAQRVSIVRGLSDRNARLAADRKQALKVAN